MNRESLVKVSKGLLIAMAGAALTFLAELPLGDFGESKLIVAAILSVVVNAGRKLLYPTPSVMLLIVAAMITAGPAFANDPPPVRENPPAIKAEARKPALVESSVYISVDLGGGRSAGGTGTVIASDGVNSLVLTNAHVAPSGKNPISVTYLYKGHPYKQEATYIGGSSVDDIGPGLIRVNGPDLALLSVEADLQAVEIADKIPAAGEAVSLYGFGGNTSVIRPTLKTGRVLPDDGYRTTAGDPIQRTSIPTVNGDSGSGIFNSAGKLVAVHWGGGCVRLDTIHAFTVQALDRKGVFGRFKDRLAARKISKALAGLFAAETPASPPPVKSASKEPVAKGKISYQICFGSYCETYVVDEGTPIPSNAQNMKFIPAQR